MQALRAAMRSAQDRASGDAPGSDGDEDDGYDGPVARDTAAAAAHDARQRLTSRGYWPESPEIPVVADDADGELAARLFPM